MIKEVLSHDDEDIETIRKLYGVDEDTIKRDVEILQTWTKQQRHFPNDQDGKLIENFLLKNKFRVEKTKQKLEHYYTMRGLYRDFYLERNDRIVLSQAKTKVVVFPLLTREKSRCVFVRFDPNPDTFVYKDLMMSFNLFMELMLRYDYSLGYTAIFDASSLTLHHMKKLYVSEISQGFELFQKVYSGRIVNVEMINNSFLTQSFMTIAKLALPQKVTDRFRFHTDMESLYRKLPKKYLPKDLGGDLESIDEMLAKWDRVFAEHLDFFDRNYHNISDENLRVGEIKNRGFFGVDDTFNRLNLD